MSEEEYRKTREFYDDERFNNNDPSFVVFEVAPDTLTQKDNQ